MDNATGAILGGLISHILPIEDNMLKVQIGIVSSQLITVMISKCSNIKLIEYFKKSKNNLLISNKYDNKINPIYYNLEEYFINKYISEIKNLQLVPKNGEITFTAEQQEFKKELKDNYLNHEIVLEMNVTSNNNNSNSNKNSDVPMNKSSNMLLSSKTATLEILKQYTQYICDKTKPNSSIITIYKIKVIEYEKSRHTEWETIYIKTNKNYTNTIVSENIQKELFNDIEHFCKNESWYSNKGIPYKRGYLLYGPPGTGKTSIIKAISNTHQLPIFNLDLSTIKSNSDMLKLVTDINYLAKNKKYIVTIEDIDRCPLFNNTSCYYEKHRQLKNNTLTLDCLLNVLDGIIETHGRIFFMSANNINVFNSISDVLFRPGRIDKQLNITYCDKPQITKIISNFYDIDRNDIEKKIENIHLDNITPATMIKYLQESPNNYNDLCNKWLNNLNCYSIDNGVKINNGNTINNTINKKRLNTNTIIGVNTKITSIKNEIKDLTKKKNSFDKKIKSSQNRFNKNEESLCKKIGELQKYTDKLKIIKENKDNNKKNQKNKINLNISPSK